MASRLRQSANLRISFFSCQDIITSVTGILTLVTLILTLYLDPTTPVAQEDPALRRRLDVTLDALSQAQRRNSAAEERLRSVSEPTSPERLAEELGQWQEQVTTLSNQLAAARQASGEQARQIEVRAEQLGLSEVRERAGVIEREISLHRSTNAELTEVVRQLENLERELKLRADAATNQHRIWILPETTQQTRQPVLVTVSATNLVCERFNQPSNRVVIASADANAAFGQALQRWSPARDYLVFYVRPSGIEPFAHALDAARQAGFQVGYDAVEENRELVFSAPPGAPAP